MKLKIPIKCKACFNKMPLSILRNQKGVTAVLVAIVAAMLLGFTALAIDVGYMYSTRNELQNVADAAALAGAGELGRIYLTLDSGDQGAFEVDDNDPDTSGTYRDRIEAAAQDTAVLNQAAGESISIHSEEIFIGIWDWDVADPANALTITSTTPDAVRVIARRDSTINNPVSTFFGKIFSFFGGSADTFQVSAVATAALSGAATVDEGVLEAPFAISEKSPCVGPITFSPTTTSCAGWHNFFTDDDYDANASDFATRMIATIEGFDGTGNEGSDWLTDYFEIADHKLPPPEVTDVTSVGELFDFSGGVNATLFEGGYYPVWTRVDEDPDGVVSVPSNPEIYPDGPPEDTPVADIIEGQIKTPAPFIALFDFFRFRDGDGEVVNNPSSGDAVDDMVVLCADFSEIDAGTVPGSFTIENEVGDDVDVVPADTVWTTTVPVYKEDNDEEGCVNPTGDIEVIGFAKVHIISPNPPPDSTVIVCLDCGYTIEPGRGGGVTAGNVRGSIPSLVE
ncbi:pilus assembly protein TadG-related protein [Desulfobacula sp.]|uniref:pilus assembly protein TadG-related protein n=1 Tax=Desulfobacula sp. TaxID=2593537 RepID=UPI0025B8158D|nr:pilus assembly protein TadG-related protein [Desulfobacula sp.]MBC2705444.1 hypothetical protein [Desulfobacula sp.]